MRYVAVGTLCVLGCFELALRLVVYCMTLGSVTCANGAFMECECFKLAHRCLEWPLVRVHIDDQGTKILR